MFKKRTSIALVVLVVATGISLATMYETGAIGISGERGVGSQYTPWDTERMVKHSDVIVKGTVLSTEETTRNNIQYRDGTDEIEQVKVMPYQLVTIQIQEVVKGDYPDKTIIVRDNMDSIVNDQGQRIQVKYENALTYKGGETGIFFLEERNGEYVMDGYYHFLEDIGNDEFRSGFQVLTETKLSNSELSAEALKYKP